MTFSEAHPRVVIALICLGILIMAVVITFAAFGVERPSDLIQTQIIFTLK
jgi:hypothetical protein